jgi:hypothetical protein
VFPSSNGPVVRAQKQASLAAPRTPCCRKTQPHQSKQTSLANMPTTPARHLSAAHLFASLKRRSCHLRQLSSCGVRSLPAACARWTASCWHHQKALAASAAALAALHEGTQVLRPTRARVRVHRVPLKAFGVPFLARHSLLVPRAAVSSAPTCSSPPQNNAHKNVLQ